MPRTLVISKIECEIINNLKENESIRRVLVGPDLWLGFLIELDIPVPSDKIHEITCLDGNLIAKIAMRTLNEHAFYYESVPFTIEFNEIVKGIRVIFYTA